MLDSDNFQLALKKNDVLVLVVNCVIDYDGRAQSHLPSGDRIIIIKSDKSLLVHQPKGSSPINYMKAHSQHELAKNDNQFLIESKNQEFKEYLTITINKVYSFNAYNLKDDEKLELAGTERDMAEMIYTHPELICKGFKPLSKEEHTKYGFIDIFGYDANNELVVIECKRYIGDPKAVTQLWRYVEKIKSSKGVKKVRGILACPKISPSAKKMLEDFGFEYAKINPPKYLEKFSKKQKALHEF
ncbi:endonuclease NucS [Candidatus Woesearchaeota archaeon]|nr:endonuclease NucS [Candidatus Woesearchaeota archaeon]